MLIERINTMGKASYDSDDSDPSDEVVKPKKVDFSKDKQLKAIHEKGLARNLKSAQKKYASEVAILIAAHNPQMSIEEVAKRANALAEVMIYRTDF
jgi:hypothetical protein